MITNEKISKILDIFNDARCMVSIVWMDGPDGIHIAGNTDSKEDSVKLLELAAAELGDMEEEPEKLDQVVQ
jgi:hypothetical protein